MANFLNAAPPFPPYVPQAPGQLEGYPPPFELGRGNMLTDIMRIAALLNLNEDGSLATTPPPNVTGDLEPEPDQMAPDSSQSPPLINHLKIIRRQQVRLRKLRKESEATKDELAVSRQKIAETKEEQAKMEGMLEEMIGSLQKFQSGYTNLLEKLQVTLPNPNEGLDPEAKAVVKLKNLVDALDLTKLEEGITALLEAKQKAESDLSELQSRHRNLVDMATQTDPILESGPNFKEPESKAVEPQEPVSTPPPKKVTTSPVETGAVKHAINTKRTGRPACICGMTFVDKHKLIKHLRYYSKEKRFVCDVCSTKFYFLSDLTAHLLKVHKISSPKTLRGCGFCGKIFQTLVGLHRHQKLIHNSTRGQKKKVEPQRDTIKVIGEREAPSISPPQVDPLPSKSSPSQSTSKKNPVVKHAINTKRPAHDACICGLTFAEKHKLTRHIRYHSQEKRFGCDDCPMKFYFMSDLTRHLFQVHGIRSPTTLSGCGFCGKRFKTRAELYRHQTLVHNSKRGVSKKMEKELPPKQKVPPPQVDIVPPASTAIRTQKFGTAQKHKVDSSKPGHVCSCSATFAGRYGLRNHIRRYTCEKNFVCQLCPAKFYFSSDLTKHMKRVHNVARPTENKFGCSFCGESFSSFMEIYMHRRHAHKMFMMRKPVTTNPKAKNVGQRSEPKKTASSTVVIADFGGASKNGSQEKRKQHAVDSRRSLEGFFCICGESYMTKGYLHKHIQYSTASRRFVCGICKHKFVWCSQLSKHLSVAHKVTSLKSFGCPKCPSLTVGSILELSIHSKEVHGISTISVGMKPGASGSRRTITSQNQGRATSPPTLSREAPPSPAPVVSSTSTENLRPEPQIKVETGYLNYLASMEHRFDPTKSGFSCKCGMSFESRTELRSHIYD